jgi:hypothetical protein
MHFPLFNTLRHTRLCLAALALGLGIHLPSQAQDGTLVAAGQITTTTCLLALLDFGTVENPTFNSKSLAFGSLLRSNLSTTKGALVSSTVGTALGHKPSPGSSTCSSPTTTFDVSILLRPEQIVTMTGTNLGTETFLKNSLSAANGGTDAVVLLKGGTSTTSPQNNSPAAAAPNALTLKPNIGLTGNYISGSNTTPGTANSWKNLSATLVNSATNNQPSPGRYVQTIQLLAVYN